MRKGFFWKLSLSNIRKNRKIYYPYILTAVLTVMMLYIITSLSENESLRSETLAFTLGLGRWVTTIFTVIFLFYTNSFLMKRRKMEFGLLNILGMEKKHVSRLVCFETLVILLVSLTLGLLGGVLLDKLLYMLLQRLLGETGGLSFYVSTSALLFATAIVSGTFLLILLSSIRQIHLSKPIELLRGGQVGEREPKAKWALALLGALMLGAGYYISIRVTNVVASILLFFVAVVLVILGTYLLLTAGSVTLLKLMRKNKRYYYQPAHFINVSGMIYRMKQNAVGLANVCILCTMVLVIVFSTVSLWIGMEDMLLMRCPFEVDAEVYNTDRQEDVEALVHKAVADEGQKIQLEQCYRYLNFAGYKVGDTYLTDTSEENLDIFGEALSSLFIITLDDYNRLTGANETLAEDEILLASRSVAHEEPLLKVFDQSFRVKGRFDQQLIQNGYINATVYSTQMLVVRDQTVLNQLDAKQKEAYGKYASSQTFYIGFHLLSGDEAAGRACAERIRNGLKAQDIRYRGVDCRAEWREQERELYGGLLFIGLFLGLLFIMAMILIIYYKQISEGYDDKERYHIMRNVGLSRAEIKRSIRSQILTVFFLPLAAAGAHVCFSFPSIVRMFSALAMTNVPLMLWCLAGSFVAFTAFYGAVYAMTAKVYYKIVS